MHGPGAGDVARMLAARVQNLCAELLPAGRREGAEWVHPSLCGTSPRALSVHLFGAKAGVFAEFDSGAKGDALDLVAHVLFAGDKKKAYAWAQGWLGIAKGATPAPLARAPAPRAAAAEDPDAIERRRAALAMWLAAEQSIAGTPVSAYLRGRGIDLSQLGHQPRSLRYAPALNNRETGRKLPAMVAAIVAPNGTHLATHRTWLAPDAAGVWRKAPLRNPKMTLGGFAGGSIRLWRGASRKPLAAAPESDTVVIAEGIETGLSIAVACPELRVLCAVNLGNLARLALPPNVLDIIVAADNDAGNPAAERLLDHAVSRLLVEGRSVRIARSSVDIAAAKTVKPPKSAATPAKAPGYLLERFEQCPEGLFLKKNGEKPRLWLCSPFKILAMVRDGEQGAWGLLLQWHDPDGYVHTEVVLRTMFAGEGGELRSLLAGGGLLMNPRQDARQALLEYLNAVETGERAQIVSQTGWAEIGGLPTFVLPSGPIGKTSERVLLHTVSREAPPFAQAGTHEEWKNRVAEPAGMNSRFILAICVAVTGPLLHLLNEDGGGVHFRGNSKIGKSLLLAIAASIWGGTPAAGAKGFIDTWRGSASGLEGMAGMRNDTLALLDEAGQVDGKELADILYMLAQGRGKLRADRSGSARNVLKFRLAYLSSGEISIGAKLAEAGKTLRAGQEVRCLDLPADAGKGFGTFDTLGDEAVSAEMLAQSLYAATRSCYGTAAPLYLAFLVDCLRRDPDFVARLASDVDALCAKWLAEHSDGAGQVRTVIRRFALFAIAGELASAAYAKVTGWGIGVAINGVRACLEAWLADRGTMGSREDAQAIQQLQDFMQRHGDSRFQTWVDKPKDEALQPGTDPTPPHERFVVQNRAGWRKWVPAKNAYVRFITPEAMRKDVLLGLDYNAAVKVLGERGYLVRNSEGRNTVSLKPPGVDKKMRLFQYRDASTETTVAEPQAEESD